MTRTFEADSRLLPILIAGLALLVGLLVASGFLAVDSMRNSESEMGRLVANQQATARIIDELQSEEGNLSTVFYHLAAGRDGIARTELLSRLQALETAIGRTTDAGAASEESALWLRVRRAADAFVAEGRDILRSGHPAGDEFYRRHENLIGALADLSAANFNAAAALQQRHAERATYRVRYFVTLLGIALVIAVGGALFTALSVNRMFRQLRWQTAELAQLSSRTMQDQEETARRLSREMHDHLGQILSAVEANLVAMKRAREFHPTRLDDCFALLREAVGNVREVSQLLRPAILDDFGLNAAIRWLAEGFAERTSLKVECDCSFNGRLSDNIETQIFRITQEALTNIARHSKATEIQLALTAIENKLRLTISDNGQGFSANGSGHGMGLPGMRARARAANAELRIDSRVGRGVTISVELPLDQTTYVTENSHSFGR